MVVDARRDPKHCPRSFLSFKRSPREIYVEHLASEFRMFIAKASRFARLFKAYSPLDSNNP